MKKIFVLTIALFCLFVATIPAAGQCVDFGASSFPSFDAARYRNISHRPSVSHDAATVFTYPNTYDYPVREFVVDSNIVIPIAVPVFVPAFQYQYFGPCAQYGSQYGQQYGYQQCYQQYSQPCPCGQQKNVASEYKCFTDKESIRKLAKAILAELKQQALSGDNGPPAVMEAPKLTAFAILQNRCAECHTSPKAAGRMIVFNASGALNPNVDRQRVLNAVQGRRMPLNADRTEPLPLPQNEVAILRQWANSE